MNKPFFFCILLFFMCTHKVASCQDVIVKKSGDTLLAKVVRINPYSIEFRKTDSTDNSILAISKSFINYIIYKNGTTDTFRVTDLQSGQGEQIYKVDPESHNYKGNYYGSMRLSDRGAQDAKKYYKKYKGAKRFAALSFLTLPYGLVPDAIIFFTPPKDANLGCPYPELMLRSEYSSAYKKKAFQIKKRQTGNGFLIGGAILTGVTAVLVGGFLLTYNH